MKLNPLSLPSKLKTKKMKKVLLAVAVVAFFASCKKDYTCTCTYTDFNGAAVTSTENYTSVSGANANLLKATCESTSTSSGVTSTACVWDKK